jgi:hypothetical protein
MAPTRRAGTQTKYSATVGSPGTFNIALPAAAQTGDLAIISLSANAGNVTGTGWTRLGYSGVTSVTNLAVYWKILTASDLGATVPATSNMVTVGVSVEVWSYASAPTATFSKTTTGSFPSATAPVNSVPLYAWAGYDADDSFGNPDAPASIAAPSGCTGAYLLATVTNNGTRGLGVWYAPPITGTTAPATTVSVPVQSAVTATIVIPPSQDQICILAGSQAGADQTVQIILAGANAAADKVLVAQA